MKRLFYFFALASFLTNGCGNRQTADNVQLVDADLSVSISGKIICPSNLIPTTSNVKVVLKNSRGGTQSIRPNANGTFSFTGLESGLDYTVSASRDHNPSLNMANYNINEVSEIMLGSRPMPATTLGFLAVDFDRNGEIEPADLLVFRRISLNIITNDALWRFVSNDLANGTNTATRIGGVNNLTLKNLTSSAANCNFILLRLGNASLNECE
jgi:hypothetical protein